MIYLPQVTLCCLTGKDYKRKEHLEALWKSQEGIRFAEVKLIEVDWVKDIGTWNEAVIKELPKYINTSHCLFIHADSEILNPNLWDDEWLELDFIGSPWPLPRWKGEYEDTLGRIQRVGNSVSLRSKKLLDLVATRKMEYHYGNNCEDGEICVWQRAWLEEQGCKFATFEQALKFGKETELPENKDLKIFLTHQV